MYRLFFAGAFAIAVTGCAELPPQAQDSQQVSSDGEPVTGSMFVRKKPKAPAPAPAQAESGGGTATSASH